MKQFLPISAQEIAERGWEQLDFLFISGDAYVDHPSFGPAVICRVLEAQGYKVAMLCQPRWDKAEYLAELGKPRLGVLISGGNLDSMLCRLRYTCRQPRMSVLSTSIPQAARWDSVPTMLRPFMRSSSKSCGRICL